MQQLQISEATAAQRRLFFHAVDATDGITAETGLTGVGRITKNGAASAASSASISEIDSTNMPGRYYIEFTAAEINTVGIIEFRFKAAACAEVIARGQVVPFDPYDATRMGLTALPNADAEAANGLFTRGTGTGQLNANVNGQHDVRMVTSSLDSIIDGAITANELTNIEDEIWNALKSAHTTPNTFGDFLDIEVSSRSSHSAAAVWAVGTRDLTALGFTLGNGDVTWVDGSDRVDVGNIIGTPPTLASGNLEVSVFAMAANVITAAAINAAAFTAAKFGAGAIDANALAADAVDKIRDGLLPTQNAAFDDINFLFVDNTDHVTPVTGATGMSVDRSINSGAFSSGTGTGPTEISGAVGMYQYDASAADMNGGVITFKFSATGGTPNAPDDVFLTIVTGGGV